MNRARGFINLNQFKSGRAIKRLRKIISNRNRIKAGTRRRGK